MTRVEIETFFADRSRFWTSRDADGLAASHAEDGTLDSPMFGKRQGRASIAKAYRQLFEIFPDWDYQGEPLLIDGEQVAQAFSVGATHVGMFLGHPGTNRRFRIQGVRLFTMTDGLIGHERRLYDFTGLLIQIGVLKGKPSA